MFRRESNKFDDVLNDPTLKKQYKTKIQYSENLILGIPDEEDTAKLLSYTLLKYGEDMIDFSSIVPDRTPIPNKDYTPIRKR